MRKEDKGEKKWEWEKTKENNAKNSGHIIVYGHCIIIDINPTLLLLVLRYLGWGNKQNQGAKNGNGHKKCSYLEK